jgi:hypothetical protein
MKRIILVFVAAFSVSMFCFSQDVITLRSGVIIQSKILEIGQTDIKYKKFDNQNGPVYVVMKSDVTGILYENGTKDVFNPETAKTEPVKTSPASDNFVGTNNATLTQEKSSKSRFLIGFSGVWPTGIWPATALSNMGTSSFLKSQGHSIKTYGFGILIQGRVTDHFSLFFDMNAYDYNILAGKKGTDISTAWTTAEGAAHWNETGAPQILYVHNLSTDVHFDMAATGFRLGGKYIIGKSRVRPWVGAAFGYYKWTANYYNEDKSKTYGKDEGYVTGLTFLLGMDFEIMEGIIVTPFADLASPVATYKMEGLFYPQWDIEYDSHIMGTYRFGLSVLFSPAGPKKK